MNAHAEVPDALPVNIDAEQHLLGAVLIDNDAILRVIGFLEPEHFTEPVHRDLYKVMRDMVRSDRKVTPITVRDFIDPNAKITDDMTLGGYIAVLAGETIGAPSAYGLGLSIHDNAIRRALISITEDAAAAARAPAVKEPPASLIADTETRLFDLSRQAARIKPSYASRPAGEFGDSLVEAMGRDAKSPPIRTGWADLDKIVSGVRRGDLHILAGRPGMMKTGMASGLTLNIARQGRAVLFFSKEMTADALAARMLSDLAYKTTLPVAYRDIIDQNLTAEHFEDIKQAAEELRRYPVTIDPRRGLTVAEICMKTRRWADYHRKKGIEPGAVVIDHLGKIRTPDRRDNRNLELGDITNALADEAGESDVPIVCLCQLSRAVEGRPNKRPMLSDLRESGHIEEDAAVVLGAYREAYYLTKAESDPDKEIARQDKLRDHENDFEVEVLKNRHGPTGVAKLWVHVPSGAIRDREWRH